MEDRTPILRVRPTDVSANVLVCGDSERAKDIAKRFENSQLVAAGREYFTYTGHYKGLRTTVCSHGVGAGGAAICFEELIRAGAKTMIRVGTCGSYLPNVRSGALIIAHAATREDGVTPELVPMAFPAVADVQVINTLRRIGQERGDVQIATGIIRTNSAFYNGVLPTAHQMWIDAGAIGIEMEYAALLIIASLRRVQAGGIFAVDGNPAEQANMTGYDPHRQIVEDAKVKSIEIGLDTLVELDRMQSAVKDSK